MKYKIVPLLLLMFTLWGCKKEDDAPVVIPCAISLNEPANNVNEEITCWQCFSQCQESIPGTRYDYFYPSYNPNNETEFAYLKADNSQFTTTRELWTFDYCTGEHKMIHDYALSAVDWSVKDWIIFSAPNYMIYKIKSSGDSLTQLTFSGTYNLSPTWNYLGTQYFYTTQTGSEGARLIADEEGNILDTLSFSIRNWQQTNMFPYYLRHNSEIEVGYFSKKEDESTLDTIAFTKSFDDFSTSDFSPSDIAWLNDKTILWVARRRLGTTDIVNGETKVLLNGYINREYSDISVSSNGKEVLINRIDVSNTDQECEFDNKHRIYLYDVEGKTERWIEIPE